MFFFGFATTDTFNSIFSPRSSSSLVPGQAVIEPTFFLRRGWKSWKLFRRRGLHHFLALSYSTNDYLRERRVECLVWLMMAVCVTSTNHSGISAALNIECDHHSIRNSKVACICHHHHYIRKSFSLSRRFNLFRPPTHHSNKFNDWLVC